MFNHDPVHFLTQNHLYLKLPCTLFIGIKRDSKGKFTPKPGGTIKEQEKRQKDRERKQFDRVLKIFQNLSIKSHKNNFKYICIIERDNGEVHYN